MGKLLEIVYSSNDKSMVTIQQNLSSYEKYESINFSIIGSKGRSGRGRRQKKVLKCSKPFIDPALLSAFCLNHFCLLLLS